MKRFYVLFACLAVTAGSFAQPSAGKPADASAIRLADGQKIIVENNTDMQASFMMGMELTSNSATVNALEVKKSTPAGYTMSSTLTRMKVSMNMMGQSNSYDSDKKEGNSEEIAKYIDPKMNKQVEVMIDNKTGLTSAEKKRTKNSEDDLDPATGIMKMFVDYSDEATVASAFEVIPAGKKMGDTWSDSTVEKDSKTVRTYTLKSITGNEAVIELVTQSKGTGKLNFQETELEIKTETKTSGEILMDLSTSQVKKRSSVADISGSVQIMGQEMPITAKATITYIYR